MTFLTDQACRDVGKLRLGWFAPLLLTIALGSNPALAQNQSRGDATLRLEYQYIHTDKFFDDLYKFDYWSTDSQVALLSGSFAFTDRWSVYATLPYVQKRFNSEVPEGGFPPNGDPHNPNDPWWIDFVPPDKRFIDDGHYHGGFQDVSFGVMYQALEGPLTVSPFIGYGFPADDYPFYAKAAIGLNLWNIPVGAAVSWVPSFSDWYLRGNLAYVFSEKPLGVNVDHWLGYLSTGYWFRPSFSMNLFVAFKWIREGLEMPWDFTDDPTYGNFPEDFDTELWWQHDRLIGHRNVNAGIGFDYFWNERYQLSGSYFTGIYTAQSNEVDYAFTLALTRYFSGD